MKITIETDNLRKFPEDDVLIWCKNWDKQDRKCVVNCVCCKEGLLEGKLASSSPIKRWLYELKEKE